MTVRGTVPIVLACAVASGCGGGTARGGRALDARAEEYVKLTLAIGRHDPMYVDAYYGPAAWKTEADSGAPVPLPELLARARSLAAEIRVGEGPGDRKRFLDKQLVATETHLRRLSGEHFPLTEECRLLFDAVPKRHAVLELDAALAALEPIVPGTGSLTERVEALRRAIYVPRDRIAATLRVALNAARRANAPFVTLPAAESFETALVTGKPWGAYNWYLGGFRSRIELNTDLPTELNALLSVMCHEGYPGHHVYNVLLEDKLVRGRGWMEYTVYPLYSPQSMLAEGTANAGEDLLFSDDERLFALTRILAPAAGVSPEAVATWDRVARALKPLRYARSEAARMLLDDGVPESEAVAFVARYALENDDRARKSIEFARTYRSYVFNYTLGEDLVRAWIGTGPDRRERFYDILRRPVVPSELVRN